jgi:hypothetical protein
VRRNANLCPPVLLQRLRPFVQYAEHLLRNADQQSREKPAAILRVGRLYPLLGGPTPMHYVEIEPAGRWISRREAALQGTGSFNSNSGRLKCRRCADFSLGASRGSTRKPGPRRRASIVRIAFGVAALSVLGVGCGILGLLLAGIRLSREPRSHPGDGAGTACCRSSLMLWSGIAPFTTSASAVCFVCWLSPPTPALLIFRGYAGWSRRIDSFPAPLPSWAQARFLGRHSLLSSKRDATVLLICALKLLRASNRAKTR